MRSTSTTPNQPEALTQTSRQVMGVTSVVRFGEENVSELEVDQNGV